MTAPRDHEIAGCWECPFRADNSRENYSRCDHPDIDRLENIHDYIDDWDDEQCPSWCPLRQAPVLVKLSAAIRRTVEEDQ